MNITAGVQQTGGESGRSDYQFYSSASAVAWAHVPANPVFCILSQNQFGTAKPDSMSDVW